MPLITYNSKIIFEKESDLSSVKKVLEWHRDATNAALKTHFGSKKNSIVDLHRAFYAQYRLNNPKVPSQIVIKAEQECLKCYRTIKGNKHKISAHPIKKSLSLRLDKRLYSCRKICDKLTISLISSGLRVKVALQSYSKLDELLGKYRFCDPLIFEKNGDLWMSLTFDVPESPVNPLSCVGVDLGKRVAAVTSEGNFYQDKNFNNQKRKLRHLKDSLKSRASSGSRSAKKHLHKLRRKEHNKNRNQTHRLANAILSEAQGQAIILEDLKGLKVKKHPSQNKNSISQVPLFDLRRILTYKAPIYGKTVITINPRFTSQIDHRTGRRDGVRQGRRYTCADGITLDADHNASVNIALRSKLPVSDATTLRGAVLDGQAIVNSPNFKAFERKRDCFDNGRKSH